MLLGRILFASIFLLLVPVLTAAGRSLSSRFEPKLTSWSDKMLLMRYDACLSKTSWYLISFGAS